MKSCDVTRLTECVSDSEFRRAFERVVGVVCDFMFVLLLYYHYLGGIPLPQTPDAQRMLRDSHLHARRGSQPRTRWTACVCASVSHLSLDVKESRR